MNVAALLSAQAWRDAQLRFILLCNAGTGLGGVVGLQAGQVGREAAVAGSSDDISKWHKQGLGDEPGTFCKTTILLGRLRTRERVEHRSRQKMPRSVTLCKDLITNGASGRT